MDSKKKGEEKRGAPQISINLDPLTIKAYSELTGQAVSTIRGQVESGFLPVLQRERGGLILINRAAMFKRCIEAADWDMNVPDAAYSR